MSAWETLGFVFTAILAAGLSVGVILLTVWLVSLTAEALTSLKAERANDRMLVAKKSLEQTEYETRAQESLANRAKWAASTAEYELRKAQAEVKMLEVERQREWEKRAEV